MMFVYFMSLVYVFDLGVPMTHQVLEGVSVVIIYNSFLSIFRLTPKWPSLAVPTPPHNLR